MTSTLVLGINLVVIKSGAMGGLYKNNNDTFRTLDYSSIGYGNVVFELHDDDDDVNTLPDYFNSTFEK